MSPFLTCFPYHRSPSACLEGTHGDRVAGDNTQHSHRLLSFSFYVTRSRTKKPNSSAHLYYTSSSAFAWLAAVAARTLNMHIPCIRMLRMSVHLSACVLCTLSPSRQSCDNSHHFLSRRCFDFAQHDNRVWVFPPVSFRGNEVTVGIQPSGEPTKQTILRNCGRSFCPCFN